MVENRIRLSQKPPPCTMTRAMDDVFAPMKAARLPWMMHYLRLPRRGVRTVFPDADSCHDRVAFVRWPSGPDCPKCSSTSVGFLEARRIFYCRDCGHQFTVMSGTIMHHSRVTLDTWFAAVADIITCFALGEVETMLTGHKLKDRHGISYAAAYRLKKLAIADLSEGEGSFLARCVCIEKISAPWYCRHNLVCDEYEWAFRQLPRPWLEDDDLQSIRRSRRESHQA